jgi:2-oxoisovalerate dehydrogenase E2 component (dihydrolipoyl transacylase)
MSTIVKMPQLGESVVEGTVARWLKGAGDRVAKNEALLEISTDKIDTEVPAPADGVLLEIRVVAGATVKAGAVLAIIGSEAEQVAAQLAADAADNSEDVRPDGRSFVSPVVARMVAEHDLDLAQIAGTGLGGRVTKKDVTAYLHEVTERPAGDAQASDATGGADVDQLPTGGSVEGQVARLNPDEVLTPLTATRRAIAQHMVMSKRTSPHVTTVFEADMTAVICHREANIGAFAAMGIALTYTPYLVAAIIAGLRAVPEANSRFTDAGIVVNRRMHIGIAVALAHGLLVPVLRDADEKNLQGLARLVNELVDRTRGNALRPADLQGGTFTLTNHGTGGSLLAIPIINQPQTGILGVGAIAKRPVVRSSSPSLLPNADDGIVIRPMCYLSFTFDHRVLDGAQGDAFLTAVKQRLENWQ